MIVVPAHAGVILSTLGFLRANPCSSRTRGGDPTPFEMKHFVDKIEYIELRYYGDLTIDYISEVCFTSERVGPKEETIKILKEKEIKLFYYKDVEIIEM